MPNFITSRFRNRLEWEKQTKLRSPKFGVSRTRLLVQNVPEGWSEARLKQTFEEAVRKRATKQTPKVTQV